MKELNGYPYQWKIYYDDGKTFDSNDGTWEESPGWGTQAVVFLRPDIDKPKLGGRGWEIAEGGSFFRKTQDGHIVSCNDDALLDYVVNMLGIVKVGRMLSGSEFRTIYARACEDLEMFDKQGFSKQERLPL